MHSKDYLAGELRKAGLREIADRAAAGYYHDYLSPLPFPELQLANDLEHVGTPEALALRERHVDGEFDATVEEGEVWMESPEGQATLAQLMTGRAPHG
jgi:hypothetical protein